MATWQAQKQKSWEKEELRYIHIKDGEVPPYNETENHW